MSGWRLNKVVYHSRITDYTFMKVDVQKDHFQLNVAKNVLLLLSYNIKVALIHNLHCALNK